MSDDRKKPLWPWIVALLIGLPALYVASFGPVCWLAATPYATWPRGPAWGMAVYWPLGDAAMRGGPIGTVLRWWIRFGTWEGRIAMIPTNSEGSHVVGFGNDLEVQCTRKTGW
jgi:hypothetical protein